MKLLHSLWKTFSPFLPFSREIPNFLLHFLSDSYIFSAASSFPSSSRFLSLQILRFSVSKLLSSSTMATRSPITRANLTDATHDYYIIRMRILHWFWFLRFLMAAIIMAELVQWQCRCRGRTNLALLMDQLRSLQMMILCYHPGSAATTLFSLGSTILFLRKLQPTSSELILLQQLGKISRIGFLKEIQ